MGRHVNVSVVYGFSVDCDIWGDTERDIVNVLLEKYKHLELVTAGDVDYPDTAFVCIEGLTHWLDTCGPMEEWSEKCDVHDELQQLYAMRVDLVDRGFNTSAEQWFIVGSYR